MDVVQIFTVILIASASALCIALIFYLNKVVKSVQSVDNNIKELAASLKPLIQSSLELSENLSKITSDAKEQLKISRSVINDVRERADRILNFESKVRTGIEDAIMPLVNNLNAIGKGIDTFWRSFKSK
ncbi:MAG: hypothetical protein HND40_07335 [Ignavibacteriota bacterium]|jgi:uncharacterized protein YoxC|nr:MAG: hypothetical protein F9K42_01740 [Ignavibacterium sp.]MBL1154597.1 hypothetical protein [Ignavibacteriota bacterium]MCO6447668.1 hypothetical protein [Ignavibacterium album]MCZ2269725.1 hypothetical protein [Ignavibacteriales bacterium]MDX9711958.1 hypothetical protein [Ignavibacteriaceae bacterium]